MNCKVCNTRMSPGDRHCPNCGNDAGLGSTAPGTSKPGPLPSAGLSRANEPDDDIELELDEVSGDASLDKPKPTVRTATPAPRKSEPAHAGSPFSIDGTGLRGLLAEQPGALEKGLRVFREDGKAVGAGYKSPVGEIDLLATDSSGNIVVVCVMEKTQSDELLADVLKRLGWARKHLASGGGKRVRGIVLCAEAPEDLSYTAAAVADTVSFKTYRLALSFDDVEI
jgi:RecB family endonuclease NucS